MPEQIHTVSDITADIRGLLERNFGDLWVEGEVSNLRLPGSGHQYFTLKDSFAQISCVLFRGAARKNPVTLRDGMQVQVFGNVSVYEARGQYQIIVRVAQPTGSGDLQARFEALKRKLDAEGLFDPARKKPLPVFPTRLGIVTSPTGAAIRDVLNVLARRAPWLRILLHPARVQGDGAAEEIAEGIATLANDPGVPRPDLILVTRGGGSIEDLWAFNEEVVARAIAASPIPVLSGVGHEIDFTIADFAADRREPTPSAAAENATPDRADLLRQLETREEAMESRAASGIQARRKELLAFGRELRAHEPGRKMRSWAQSIDYLGERLESATDSALGDHERNLERMRDALFAIAPEETVRRSRETLERLSERWRDRHERRRLEMVNRVSRLGDLLHSLSPESTIRRGYSFTTDAQGRLITSPSQVEDGDKIRTRVAGGEIDSVVEETEASGNRVDREK